MKRILAFVFSFVMIVGIVPMPVHSETINEEETVTTVEAVNETIEVEGTDEVEEAEDDVEAEITDEVEETEDAIEGEMTDEVEETEDAMEGEMTNEVEETDDVMESETNAEAEAEAEVVNEESTDVFQVCGTLDLNGFLDGVDVDTLEGYGTVDVYIDGQFQGTFSDYHAELPQGTMYEFKGVQPTDGKEYGGCHDGVMSGDINDGETIVSLTFNTVDMEAIGKPLKTEEWNGHVYMYFDTPSSWHAAKYVCEQYGGHLVTVASAEENDFLQGFTDGSYWLGATCLGDTKEWITGEPFDYGISAIADGYEAGGAAWDEDLWTDVHPFICEIDASSTLLIISQPQDQYAVNGEKAYVSVTAVGEGLSYQWYLKNKTGTKFTKSSITKNIYSVIMKDEVNGRQLYCVVTDKHGNSVTTNTVTLYKYVPLEIIEEPQDCFVANGQKASATVQAVGNDLTYQWYLKSRTGTKFSKSSITSNTYNVTMEDKVDGRQLYCVVTDRFGNSLTTNTVTLHKRELIIVEQPQDCYVPVGEKANVTVRASGEGLTYQWYLKNKTSTKFGKSSITRDTYSVTMSDAVDGRQLYCVITDQYGTSVTSETVTLHMYQLLITTQPQDCYVASGERASITVEASGNGLAYQWYLKNKTSTKFGKSSITKNTYSVTMSDAVDGRQLYCVITDQYGNSVTSNTVTLNMHVPLAIISQPEDSYTAIGKKASVAVGAVGIDISYQWYVKNKTATKFSKSSVVKNTYSVTMSETVEGRQLYCVVTDKFGNSMTTNTITLHKRTPLSIISQPKNINDATTGMEYTVGIVAEGDGLSYRWKESSDGGVTWVDSNANDTANLTITATLENEGHMYYCTVTDMHGDSLDSDIITLHIGSFDDGIFTYRMNSAKDGLIVTGYLVEDATLTVPAEVHGLPVVEIGEEAFMGNTNLVSIDLPDTITVIHTGAFKNCSNLKYMN